jgi:hypothetical protein
MSLAHGKAKSPGIHDMAVEFLTKVLEAQAKGWKNPETQVVL